MKRNQNMVRRIIVLASILALLMSATISIIGIIFIRNAYYESFEEQLHAVAVMMSDEISHEWQGDWSLTDGGQLRKGNVSIHDAFQKQLDDLHEQTGVHFTVFYGDTRYITSLTDAATGERMEGTKASDVVVNKVLNKGEEYLATNFDIGGNNWYAYYMPLTNSDGSVVGMIFAGRSTETVEKNLTDAALAILGVFLFFTVVNLIAARIIISRTSKSIGDIVGGLKKLEDGELSFYIADRTFDRKDELGVIAESSAELRDKLQDVIQVTKELSAEVSKSGENLSTSAETAAHVADQVASAVEDISRGAVSQAENVESSLTNTNEMGDSIEDITDSIEGLSIAANEMMNGANRTVDALTNLMSQNEDVMASMEDIDAQIRLTNDSVKEIAEASNIITSISEQTNLLSLNASIEAARAGEYGRGFAVVASEIGTLAEQSKKAAVSINEIVETLVGESQKSVDTIQQLSVDMNAQNQKLNSTKSDMDVVVNNVNHVDHSTKLIAEKIHLLNGLKASFSEIIEELSAISQQNAASSQETNASMEELNATFALISDASVDLRKMAETLNEKMEYFSIEASAAEA
ncbi:MAG: methyl-accepting chemotaxis protein [Lachnospiraceae bacterium]|nr:methyl-accepting chemotaxis protein [Lachnospiraceae bacterium]